MDEQNAGKNQRRRAYRRAKRRTVLPWKIAAILLAVLTAILTPLNAALHLFDNTVAVFVGGSFWELENPDPHAQYFQNDFDTVEEMTEYGLDVCRRVEAEGAALLMNDNGALPLAEGTGVSCFSTSSVNLVYGGTGSGNIDASTADSLKTALEKSGLSVNPTLWDFYTQGPGSRYTRDSGGFTSAAAVGEAPWSAYTGQVIHSLSDYGGAAIVVLSRVGGEGVDLSFQEVNYLALDENERDLLKNLAALKSQGAIQRIVVLLNTANPLQLDFLKDNRYQVDACLWIGDVGAAGVNAVADILTGRVNPSGRLVDTYCYDNFSSPAMANFVPTIYQGYEHGEIPDHAKSYMIYQEGIYVGYKYYETRYEDQVMGTGNAGGYVYSDDVAFPFGHGLSYTTFEYALGEARYDGGALQIDVTVKNTGGVPGRETVQLYAQAPYTSYDREHGVEKAAVQLAAFGKTRELAPGQSQTLRLTVDPRDLASFDAYGTGSYILDAGDYYFTAAANAHSAVNNILAAKGYTRADGMDAEGDPGLVRTLSLTPEAPDALAGTWTQDGLLSTAFAASASGAPIVSRLSQSDPNLYDGVREEVKWVSRSDWQGTLPTEIVKLTLTDRLKRDLQDVQYDPADYAAVDMPTLEAKNGLKLYDLMGKDFHDPQWEPLLDQLTFDEMVKLIGDAFHWTMPVKSIEAPGTRDENGPQGLTASLLGSDATQLAATAFTSEDVMAATFDLELMAEVGRVMGGNCLASGVACLYGPGCNIHRTPYGGRNFEYYSEDGFLSGAIAAAEVAAIQAKGVQVVMKHFALNDCEQDRIGLGVWLSEQAARELYLKAFQAPLEKGNGNGVMMAYTRWGAQWSGGNQGLGAILREEWGCRGMNITDNVLTPYVNGPDGILAGTTIYDAMLPYVTWGLPKYRDDPVIVSAMREACHHNLYAIANSCGMNGVGPDTTIRLTQPVIITQVTIINCAAAFFLLVCAVMWALGVRRLRRTPEYAAWKGRKRGHAG